MASAKKIIIKESVNEIKKLIKNSKQMITKRLQALLVFKENEEYGVSKRFVAKEIGVNHNSVQTWRSLYINGGINLLMSHSKIGYKPSLISKVQEDDLKKKLDDPYNGIVGFVELLDWFNTTYQTNIKYKTFHGFVVRKYGAKIKVARKTHVKKDIEAGETLKKTSAPFVKKLLKKKHRDSNK